MYQMELRHLRYFVAVAEEMNIHRAAERLNISQPPLSLSIQQLEQEVGAELFTRKGRGIQITRAGEVFLERARFILAQSKEAAKEACAIGQGQRGTLKVGFISSAVTGILQETISPFQKKYPDIRLDIR
jgi:DNA-binding transcriptional LysR family regulator